MDVNALTANAILKVPAGEPERIFTPDLDAIKKDFHILLKKWHQDRCKHPKAKDITIRINELHDAAIKKVMAGIWKVPGLLEVTSTLGKKYQIKYKKDRPFELGHMYIGHNILVYEVAKANKDLFQNALRRVQSFRFPDNKRKEEFTLLLPRLKVAFETANACYMVMEKTEDVVLLRDLMEYMGGEIPPKVMAWVMSTLCNMANYLQWHKMTHNAISLDTFFVSTVHHTGLLLGGWWYAVPEGQRLLAAPARTNALMSSSQRRSKTSERVLDLDSIRLLGREMLGDAEGIKLRKNKKLPKELVGWLCSVSTGDALKDYDQWDKVLKASFGPRRFHKLEITSRDVYK